MRYLLLESALGQLLVGLGDRGVRLVQFVEAEPKLAERVQPLLCNQNTIEKTYRDAIDALVQYIAGTAPLPQMPLDTRGTAFQRDVWQALGSTPMGEVISYRTLAERIGRPRAVRAVASACAQNTIALLIPCHRVVRSDGQLGGYRWGLARKRALLACEARYIEHTPSTHALTG